MCKVRGRSLPVGHGGQNNPPDDDVVCIDDGSIGKDDAHQTTRITSKNDHAQQRWAEQLGQVGQPILPSADHISHSLAIDHTDRVDRANAYRIHTADKS